MSQRIRLQEAFKLALSMTLMFWLALWMNWDMASNGALAIILISLGSTGASLRKGVLRIVGTTVGLAVGLLVVAWFAQDRWLTLLFLYVYLVAIGYAMQRSQYSYAWYVAGFLPPVLWATTYLKVDADFEAFRYASFRYLETTSGIVIYTLVCILIWPRNAGDQLNQQGRDLWARLRELFGFYRRQLAEGELPSDASAVRARLAGDLAQMLTTLQAAYADTPGVMEQKKVWETLRVSVRALTDALELWRESINDCQRLDLATLLPGFGPGLDTVDKRLERIGALWQAREAHNDASDADEDTDLLKSLALGMDSSASADLSHADRAALMSFTQQVEILDRATRESLRALRALAGLESSRTFRLESPGPDLFRPSAWDPQRLAKALFPASCFLVAYVFWIYTDPPGGPSVPSTVVAISLNFVLSRIDPIAMLKVMLVVMWVAVAPVYFFVMPALEGGVALLSLIFAYTFFFGYLGGKRPVLKLIPILLFVEMTGISNQQSYSFMVLADGAQMFFLVLSVIAVVDMLWTPSRPERLLLHSVQRFFRGCARVLGAFAPGRREDQARGRRVRKRYLESMVLPAPDHLQATVGHLDYKLFPDNNAQKVSELLTGLQSIAFRLQALEIAHERVVLHHADWMGPLGPLGDQLRERLQRVFARWARFEGAQALEDERSALQQVSRDLEERLNAIGRTDDQSRGQGQAPRDLYALLGCVRGLIEAMAQTQDAVRQINWRQWAAARF